MEQTAPLASTAPTPSPSPIRWLIGFLAVGFAWGFTTPYMRRAALAHKASQQQQQQHPEASDDDDDDDAAADGERRPPMTAAAGALGRKLRSARRAVVGLVRRPAYAIPLLVNVTGSVWFFLLVGSAELSLTVPITNSLAFLFTVLGEYCADGTVVSPKTWVGIALVITGIALCVHSKIDLHHEPDL